MPSKRGVIVLVLAIAVVGAIVVWLTSDSGHHYRTYTTDQPAGQRLAREACGDFRRFVTLARNNGSSKEGMALLARFENKAAAAYAKDVKWTRLMSAAQSLRAGFKADDASSARAGYVIGSEECGRL